MPKYTAKSVCDALETADLVKAKTCKSWNSASKVQKEKYKQIAQILNGTNKEKSKRKPPKPKAAPKSDSQTASQLFARWAINRAKKEGHTLSKSDALRMWLLTDERTRARFEKRAKKS